MSQDRRTFLKNTALAGAAAAAGALPAPALAQRAATTGPQPPLLKLQSLPSPCLR